MLRAVIRSALMDANTLLQWVIEKLTPDNPMPPSVPPRDQLANDICEDCSGDCGVCQTLQSRARYYAPSASGFGAPGAYHPRVDHD